jgi:hypothetical protein
VDRGQQVRRTVDDGGVDDLTAPGALGLQECGEDAHDQVGGAAAEVADEVQRDLRRPARCADGAERAGDGDVADVVARRRRQRPGLAPAGHPAVHEPRVARPHRVGTDAEPLGDTGAVALDQHVGTRHEGEHDLHGRRLLQVEHDRPLAAVEHVCLRRRQLGTGRALHPDDVGPHVGQRHAGERAGPDAGELDDRRASEGATGVLPVRHGATPPDLSGMRRSCSVI